MKGSCSARGACCNPVLCCTKKNEMGGREGSPFTTKHWHRISKKEAIKRNPRIASMLWKTCYYECDQFDVKSGKCLAHDDPIRPYACTEYPKYLDKINTDLYPNCGFAEKEI